jgi:methanethiol S-methyltransferase
MPLLFAWLGAAAFVASLAFFLFSYFFTFGVALPSSPGRTGVIEPVLIDLALFTIFALHHSLFARPRFKSVVNARLSPAFERTFYTWIASLLFIAVCWFWRPVPGVLYILPSPWYWLGVALQATGIVLTLLGARSLDGLELAGVRQITRAHWPDGSLGQVELQTRGVYALVRHPLYFAWALLVFGAANMTATRFTFAVVSTLYLAIAIPFEERGLIRTFGPEYASYRNQVRWRMLPGLY